MSIGGVGPGGQWVNPPDQPAGGLFGQMAALVSKDGIRPITGLQAGSTALVTALNAATLSAQLAGGGTFQYPYGDYTFDPVTITATAVIKGHGGNNGYSPATGAPSVAEALASGDVAPSIMRFSTTTADCLVINAYSCKLEGIHFVGAQSATAGALVRAGSAGVSASGFKMVDCSAKWGYIQCRISNADAYNLRGNYLLGARQNALYVENTSNVDYGDPDISGNQFIALYQAPAAVYVKGGGGLRIVNNKFNWGGVGLLDMNTYNWVRHIHIDNPAGSTSVMTVTGNSFENCSERSIYVDCSTAGSYSNIVIGTNEFFNIGSSSGQVTVEIAGGAGNLLHAINFSGNVLHQAGGVKFSYVEGGTVGTNTWHELRSAAVIRGVGATCVDVMDQTINKPGGTSTPNGTRVLYQDLDAIASVVALSQRGRPWRTYYREIGDNATSEAGVSSNSVYSTQFKVSTPQYGALRFRVHIMATSSANGQASMICERFLANESAAGTLAIIGADTGIARVSGTTGVQAIGVSATNPICGDLDVQFSMNTTAANNMTVNISIKRAAAATGTLLKGTVVLEVDGAVEFIQRGP